MNSDQNAVATEAAQLVEARKMATTMGITFHPNIGLNKLQERIKAERPDLDDTLIEDGPSVAVGVAPLTVMQQAKLIEQNESIKLNRIRKAAAKLTRIILICKNPAKQEWPGEIFCAGSTMMGSFKKFVPFSNDEGWHVPQVVLQMIEERECQIHVNAFDDKGRKIKKSKTIKEFTIQILDPLSHIELNELAQRQAMSGSIAG